MQRKLYTWLNIIEARSISDQCILQSSQLLCRGLPRKVLVCDLLLPYLQFASSTGLCRSLLWMDHYFAHHVCSLLALLFEDHLPWSPNSPILQPALSTPHWKWAMVGIVLDKFFHWNSFSVTKMVGDCLKGLFLLIVLLGNLPPQPCIFTRPPTSIHCTSSQARLQLMSLT